MLFELQKHLFFRVDIQDIVSFPYTTFLLYLKRLSRLFHRQNTLETYDPDKTMKRVPEASELSKNKAGIGLEIFLILLWRPCEKVQKCIGLLL